MDQRSHSVRTRARGNLLERSKDQIGRLVSLDMVPRTGSSSARIQSVVIAKLQRLIPALVLNMNTGSNVNERGFSAGIDPCKEGISWRKFCESLGCLSCAFRVETQPVTNSRCRRHLACWEESTSRVIGLPPGPRAGALEQDAQHARQRTGDRRRLRVSGTISVPSSRSMNRKTARTMVIRMARSTPEFNEGSWCV
jgi:hypothetical protein